jgi:hypothetical protein
MGSISPPMTAAERQTRRHAKLRQLSETRPLAAGCVVAHRAAYPVTADRTGRAVGLVQSPATCCAARHRSFGTTPL